jgi:hypothetical protein
VPSGTGRRAWRCGWECRARGRSPGRAVRPPPRLADPISCDKSRRSPAQCHSPPRPRSVPPA